MTREQKVEAFCRTMEARGHKSVVLADGRQFNIDNVDGRADRFAAENEGATIQPYSLTSVQEALLFP